MSNFVGNKPNPLSLLLKGAKKILTGGSQKDKGKAIKKVQVGTKLKFKRDEQDKFPSHDPSYIFVKGCFDFNLFFVSVSNFALL